MLNLGNNLDYSIDSRTLDEYNIGASTNDNGANVVKFQSAYSTLNNAYQNLLSANNGSFIGKCADNDENCVASLLEKYLPVKNTCPANDLTTACWSNNVDLLNGAQNQGLSVPNRANPGFSLTNGIQITIGDTLSGRCSTQGTSSTENICFHIFVNIDPSNPNPIVGKDIFEFLGLPDQLVPAGGSNGFMNNNAFSTANDCNSSNNGYSCAGNYLSPTTLSTYKQDLLNEFNRHKPDY